MDAGGNATATSSPPPDLGVALNRASWAVAIAPTIDSPRPSPRACPLRSPFTRRNGCGNGGLQIQATNGNTAVNGVAVNGPAFRSAMQACHSKLPNGGHPQPLTESQRNAALKFSACMRWHGLTNFPDPTFSGPGVRLSLSKSSGIDPSSPAFQAAQTACGSVIGKAG